MSGPLDAAGVEDSNQGESTRQMLQLIRSAS